MSGRCGFVAIVGRPNVGKSTLLNRILGQKISITSRRPQTTRHQILGIHTIGESQAVFIDTPGLHQDTKGAMNRYLNRAAASSLADVDLVIMVVDKLTWNAEDQHVFDRVSAQKAPVLLVINKVDQIQDKAVLLPRLTELTKMDAFQEIFPLSAKRGTNVETLEQKVLSLLPKGVPFFPEDQITDRSERFLASEIVREKLTRVLDKEIPYALSVEVETFKREAALLTIETVIWVERASQKAIVIGSGGAVLKSVGTRARGDLEKLFGQKVFLRLWVRVKEHWTDDERALLQLGYADGKE